MGLFPSASRRRRRDDDYYYPHSHHHHHYQNPPPPPSASYPPPPALPPPSGYAQPYPLPPPYNYCPQQGGIGQNYPVRYNPGSHGGAWFSTSSPSASRPPWTPTPPAPPYVEHQQAKTIKNDVNVHKDTIRLERDEDNPDQHLVSFIYDSLVDGSATIYYFAMEGPNCSFSPIYPDFYKPTSVPFQKGVKQKFCQPSGSGIDLGFFELDDLSKPSSQNVFPLIIYAEASPPSQPSDEHIDPSGAASRAQITQAVIQQNSDGSFIVKVAKQILWVDGSRYELQEIFGFGGSAEPEFEGDEEDLGKDCVICLSEPRDTAVLPCRHMCMCSDCAKALRLQSNKCPICRQPVEKLIEIKVKKADR